jgi:hypothetical protein
VEVSRGNGRYEVSVSADPSRPMMLHWAVDEWRLPQESCWPSGTRQACPLDVLLIWLLRPSALQSWRPDRCSTFGVNCPLRENWSSQALFVGSIPGIVQFLDHTGNNVTQTACEAYLNGIKEALRWVVMQVDDKAVQTPFPAHGQLRVSFPEDQCPNRCNCPLPFPRQPRPFLNHRSSPLPLQISQPVSPVSELLNRMLECARKLYVACTSE